MKKPTITNSGTKPQVKQNEDLAKQLILNRVNKDSQKDKFTDESFDQYNEKETILDMVSKLPFRKFISKTKEIAVYGRKFRPAFYNQLYRLTGLQPDPLHPNRRPSVFAKLTLDIVYSSFPDGMVSYLQENNPADADGFRMYKHFQLFSKLGEKKLLDIIDSSIKIMKKSRHMDHFWRLWSKENNSPFQGDMFEDD
jgi:hypothetical protein